METLIINVYPDKYVTPFFGSTQLRLYEFDPEKRSDFYTFYQKTIIPWLKEAGVKEANVWTVERDDLFLFTISCTPNDPPWNTIPGLRVFAKGEDLTRAELPIQPRYDLRVNSY